VVKEAPKTTESVFHINTPEIFSREQILSVLKMRAKQLGKNHENRLMVGTVGYPNVGKSSLINVLCGRKRVGVAAMPGKTKHFQTLLLEDDARDICLVDCPGLVFPSFANSKAEMYCCGVLPIQNIKEYLAPISLIVSRVPKEVLEKHYKIKLPPRESAKYTTTNFLSIYALMKGWITGGSGNPNIAEAAKVVLKDYTTGSLVFCHVRPDFDIEKHKPIQQAGFGLKLSTDVSMTSNAQDYTQLAEEQVPMAGTTATATP
jgi:ribosome biogenesis GTPase A